MNNVGESCIEDRLGAALSEFNISEHQDGSMRIDFALGANADGGDPR